MSTINDKIIIATKWSSIAEVIAKLITPVTSIVLARLLTPDAFGVIATITMIISFAEIFADSGFQKYIVQHEFDTPYDLEISMNVAFWSNLSLSLIIWGIIALFSSSLATMVGNSGLGHVLTIACVSIPLTAFSSIQIALYKRKLDFKTLFKVRIISALVPLLVTIPLALYLRTYWALVIGTIATHIVNVIVLSFYSSWKPSLEYSFSKFRDMFSFSAWSVFEAVSIWLTSYVDIFIIGVYLNEFYLGLYKTSITIVEQIMGLITAATTPVLFSSLSRLQTDENGFKVLFYKFQQYIALLVIPIGVGIFCYSDLVTKLLLGDQWIEASSFIGLWGLTSSVTIVFSHYTSEVYRAKGRPRLSALVQILHVIILCPAVLFAVKYGFETLALVRSLIRLELVIVNCIVMYMVVHISPIKMLQNVSIAVFASIMMGIIAYFLKDLHSSVLWQFITIFICAIVYFMIVLSKPSVRQEIVLLIRKLLK